MWTEGFRFSWRKMETTAQTELGWRRVVCDTLGVTEEEVDQISPEEKIWREKCGQRASGSAGGRWRRQHKTELGWRRMVCGL